MKCCFVLGLLFGLSTANLLFDIDQDNGSPLCQGHFSCKSDLRSDDHLQYLKLNSSVPVWYELCNCDEHCYLFGDCCHDAPVLATLKLHEWSFVKIRLGSKISFMSLMKSKCTAKLVNNYLWNMCQTTGNSPYFEYLLPDIEHFMMARPTDEFQNWRVTSRKTLITYRNLYCAMCNNDTDVQAWDQKVRCNEESNKCTTVSTQTSPDVLAKMKLERSPLQVKVYSACSLGWYKMNAIRQLEQTVNIIKKCLILYQPVVLRDPHSKKVIVFKNKYCAECNDYADESMVHCPSEAIDQSLQVPPAYNLITSFDTNFVTGGLIDERDNRTCSPQNVYNPLTNKCQNVIRPSSIEDKEMSLTPNSPHPHKSSAVAPAQQSIPLLATIQLVVGTLFLVFSQ